MRPRVALLILLLTTGVALGVAQSKRPAASPPETSATITGRVVDSQTGGPLEHVRVHLTPTGSETDYAMIETDRHGVFNFGLVESGSYVLTLQKNGFLSELRGETSVHVGSTSSMNIRLRMIPANLITGRVLDERGEPMLHVSIFLLKFTYTRNGRKIGISKQTTTDDRGEFRLFDLYPGNYVVVARSTTATARGTTRKRERWAHANPNGVMSYDMELYPSWEPDHPEQGIHLTGRSEEHVEFHLRPTRLFSVAGTIRNVPYGGSLQGVKLVPVGRPALWLPETTVAPGGGYLVTGVAPGDYVLQVTASNREATAAAEQLLASNTPVVVAEKNLTGLDVVLDPALSLVEGRVKVLTSSPSPIRVNGLSFTRVVDDRGEANSTSTIPAKLAELDSRFTAAFLDSGTYFVDRILTDNRDLYIQAVKVNGVDVTNIGIHAERATFYPVEITLSDDGATIGGSVVGSDGVPFAGAVIGLVPTGNASKRPDLFKTVTSDQNGAFVISGLAPGAYRAVAFPPGTLSDAIFDPDQLKMADGTGVDLTVAAHDSVPLVMRLPLAAGEISINPSY